MKRLIAVACFLLTLSGCATSINLSPAQAKQIHRVHIDKQVKMPASMYFYAPHLSSVLVGAAAGAAVGGAMGVPSTVTEQTTTMTTEQDINSAAMNSGQKIAYITQKNHIYFASIIRQAIYQAIKKQHRFQLVASRHADAILKLHVIKYGFMSRFPFSSEVGPFVSVEGKLVRHGKVIWQQRAGITPLYSDWKMPYYEDSKLYKKPAMIRKILAAGAKDTAYRLVNKL